MSYEGEEPGEAGDGTPHYAIGEPVVGDPQLVMVFALCCDVLCSCLIFQRLTTIQTLLKIRKAPLPLTVYLAIRHDDDLL